MDLRSRGTEGRGDLKIWFFYDTYHAYYFILWIRPTLVGGQAKNCKSGMHFRLCFDVTPAPIDTFIGCFPLTDAHVHINPITPAEPLSF